MSENRLDCRDRNECLWQPCGQNGKCINLDRGQTYRCECDGGYSCQNCTCDNLGEWGYGNSIKLSLEAWIAIISCVLAYIRKNENSIRLTIFFYSLLEIDLKSGFPFNFLFIITLSNIIEIKLDFTNLFSNQ